jgi:hypothetical protein
MKPRSLSRKLPRILPQHAQRPLFLSLALIAATVLAGLAVRFAHIGLPGSAVKYGGSMLWALMIYWIVSTLRPALRPLTAAVWAGIITTAIEFFKLYHAPSLDAFRLTLPGILLLGRIFSAGDILSYWIAIACGLLIDSRLRRAGNAPKLRSGTA